MFIDVTKVLIFENVMSIYFQTYISSLVFSESNNNHTTNLPPEQELQLNC